MTGRHEGPPLGSAARDATASPYAGRHRDTLAVWSREGFIWPHEPDDPPRCWSCGHPFDALCECLCCHDDHGGGPDDV